MRDNASFGGDDEREDLDGLCDSLRDELLSDQMSDRANMPPSDMFERDVEAKPIIPGAFGNLPTINTLIP